MPDIHDNNIKSLGGSYAAQVRAGKIRRNAVLPQWGTQRKLVKDYAHDVRVGVKNSAEQARVRFQRGCIVAIDEEDLHFLVDVDCSPWRCRLHHSHLS
jgi:hypothetical protein